MAFRDTELGALVFNHPRRAASRLKRLFAQHRSVTAVAEQEGVDASTVHRWIAHLVAEGFGDPRDAKDGKVRPRKGPAVKFDAAARYDELRGLFSQGLTQEKVAARLGRNRATVIRWIKRVIDGGHGDPRASAG